MTKGTFFDMQTVSYEPRYIMAVQMKEDGKEIAVVFLESTTNHIYFAYLHDDQRFTLFKKLLAETKPIEILFSPYSTHPTVLSIFHGCYFHPSLLRLHKPEHWDS